MKQTSRSLIAAALAISMLAISSCAAAPTSTSSTNESSTDESAVTDQIVDFGGRTVTIMSTWDIDPRVQAENLRPANYEEVLARWNQIEQEYNCILKVNADPNTYANFASAFNSGDNVADIVSTSIAYTYPVYMVNGLLEPLDDYMDIYGTEEKPSFFSKDLSDAFSLNGKHYAVASKNTGYPGYVILYNKRIFETTDALAKYDLNDLVNTKKWTWDLFRQVAKDATFDTADGKHVTGIASQGLSGELLVPILVASNGGLFIKKQDGKDVPAFEEPAFMEALEFANQLATDKSLGTTGTYASWTGSMEAFKQGQVAMLVSDYWRVTDYHESLKNDKFGILPAPIGPRLTDYNCDVTDVPYFAIVKGAKDPDKLGKLLTALLRPLPSSEQAMSDTLERSLFDSESLDVMNMLVGKSHLRFHTGYTTIITYFLYSHWGLATNTPPATYLAGVKGLITADMTNSWIPRSVTSEVSDVSE